MSSQNEMITIQCGHYANHVGTHWWNIHESQCYSDWASPGEFNYNVLFNEGENLRKEVTFTPRLIAVDYKGSLGPVPELGSLYDEDVLPEKRLSPSSVSWAGDVELLESAPITPNRFLQALDGSNDSMLDASNIEDQMEVNGKEATNINHKESTSPSTQRSFREEKLDLTPAINTWADYMKCLLHPRSITVVKEHSLMPGLCGGLENSNSGNELFSIYSEKLESDLFYMMEKCDALQGFNFLTDVFDGISGFSSDIMKFLKDELPKKALVCVPCLPEASERFKKYRGSSFLNTLFAFAASSEFSSLILPLSLNIEWFGFQNSLQNDSMCYDSSNLFQTSSVLGAVLHSVLLPLYLQEDGCLSLHQYTDLCALDQRKFAGVTSNYPSHTNFDDVMAFCPGVRKSFSKPISILSVYSGYKEDVFLEKSRYFASTNPAFVRHDVFSKVPTAIEAPFPPVFTDKMHLGRRKVPIFSAVRNCSLMGESLDRLVGELSSSLSRQPVRSALGRHTSVNTCLETEEALEVLCRQAGYYHGSS